MADERISYDTGLLKRSGAGMVGAHQQTLAALQGCDTQINGFGQWWNPDNDPNDVIGGALGGCVTAAHQMIVSTGRQNLELLRSYGEAMQAMGDNTADAENTTAGAVSSLRGRAGG